MNPADGQRRHGDTPFWSTRIVKLLNSEDGGILSQKVTEDQNLFRSLAVMSAHVSARDTDLVLLDTRKAGYHLLAGWMDPPPALVDRSILVQAFLILQISIRNLGEAVKKAFTLHLRHVLHIWAYGKHAYALIQTETKT